MQTQHPVRLSALRRPSSGRQMKMRTVSNEEQEERSGQWNAGHKKDASATPIGKSDGGIDKHFLTPGHHDAHMDAARTGRADRDARKRRGLAAFGDFRRDETWH
jgi:hypothetical protein